MVFCMQLALYVWYLWRDSNPHCTGSKPVASTNWATKVYKLDYILIIVALPTELLPEEVGIEPTYSSYSVNDRLGGG